MPHHVQNGETALIVAAKFGRSKLVNLMLLSGRVDVNLTDKVSVPDGCLLLCMCHHYVTYATGYDDIRLAYVKGHDVLYIWTRVTRCCVWWSRLSAIDII